MAYFFSKTIACSFEEGLHRAKESIKREGFGLVSEVDLQSKIKEKLGTDFKGYTIIGACNPAYAYKAVLLEDKVGTMLPCNVVVIDQGDGLIEVAGIDPVESMMGIQNDALKTVALEVTQKMEKIIEGV